MNNPFESAKNYAGATAGAAVGLLAAKSIPGILKLESPFARAGVTAGAGLGALFLGRKNDFAKFAGIALLSMAGLELLKRFLPIQLGDFAYEPEFSAYPTEETVPLALGEGYGDSDGVEGAGTAAYPYGDAVADY